MGGLKVFGDGKCLLFWGGDEVKLSGGRYFGGK